MRAVTDSLKELGKRVAAARIRQRYGVKAAAEAANISRDTWTKIEKGQSVHDVKRAAALELLGLDDRGEPVVGGGTEDDDHVAAGSGDLVDQDVSNAEVLAEVRGMRRDLNELREDHNALSRRVAGLESRPEPMGGADGQT